MTIRGLPGSETTETKEDRSLIRSAKSGDIQAFEALVKKYQNRVLAVAYRIVGSREDARDVAQDVFIRLYRFLPKFRNGKVFFTWLYRIVLNASYDFLKKENRFRSVPLEGIPDIPASIQADSTGSDSLDKVLALTDRLSIPQKTALILREVEDCTCREIARIMECPEGTVRSHLHHARKHLKTMIEKHYPEILEGYHRDVS